MVIRFGNMVLQMDEENQGQLLQFKTYSITRECIKFPKGKLRI